MIEKLTKHKKILAFLIVLVFIVSVYPLIPNRKVYSLGYIGSDSNNISPIEISKNSEKIPISSNLPGTFDLRKQRPKSISAIKYQGEYGTCWAFGILSSAESSLNNNSIFSESHLVNSSYNKDTWVVPNSVYNYKKYDLGGTEYVGINALSKYYGPATEVEYPYNKIKKELSNEQYTDIAGNTLTKVKILPAPAEGEMNTEPDEQSHSLLAIKQVIYSMGAVTLGYHGLTGDKNSPDVLEKYFKWSSSSQYIPKRKMADHMVSVVGYDDNYSAKNFSTTPPGNGAFIVRNSWGKKWGDKGYFYLSYYDKTIELLSYYDLSKNNNTEEKALFLDNDGYRYDVKYQSYANIFKMSSNANLNAISFFTNRYTKYKVEIHDLGNNNSNPGKGKKVSEFSGSVNSAGFYKANLITAIKIKNGNYFSVILELDDKAHMSAEGDDVGSAENSTISKNESFYSKGGKFVDFYDAAQEFNRRTESVKIGNFDIKAYVGSSTSQVNNNEKIDDGENASNDKIPKDAQKVRVKRVVDGDTIELTNNEKVRLIGVDTPETVNPRKAVGCYGKKASNYTNSKLNGKIIYIKKDSSQNSTDMYGRLLRYVFLSNGTNFNNLLIAKGYGTVYVFNNNHFKYYNMFHSSENASRKSKKGLWGKCIVSKNEYGNYEVLN